MGRHIKLALVVLLLLVAVLLLGINALTGNRSASKGTPRITTGPTPASSPASRTSQPYTVEMSPMGRVAFKAVPQRIVTLDANYNDMLVAVRRNHGLLASGYANNKFDGYYKDLPTVDTAFDDKLKYLSTGGGTLFDKETLYGLHADIHHIDPVQLAHSRGWSKADVDEIAANVAPFFANRYSRTNDYKGPEPYQYYTVWELSEKMGEAYREEGRVVALKAAYDEMVASIQRKLPPKKNRPRVGIVIYSNNVFLPYSMAKGFDTEQYRAVGAVDAFAEVANVAYSAGGGNAGGTRLDLEGMMSINPDILITPFAIMPGMRHNHDNLIALKDNLLAKRLKAFQTSQIYPGGTPLQGPISLLFQVEMAAKQIYPDLFGAYRDDQQYPAAEQLFDRARVAEILNAAAEGQAP